MDAQTDINTHARSLLLPNQKTQQKTLIQSGPAQMGGRTDRQTYDLTTKKNQQLNKQLLAQFTFGTSGRSGPAQMGGSELRTLRASCWC